MLQPSFGRRQHLTGGQNQRQFLLSCTTSCAKALDSKDLNVMANDAESDISTDREGSGKERSGWLRFALLTAASAVAGGLATAWFYRKTLNKLRETGESAKNTDFGSAEEPTSSELEDDF
jgi:hypothetical protein